MSVVSEELQQAIDAMTETEKLKIAISALYTRMNLADLNGGSAGDVILQGIVASGSEMATLLSKTSAEDKNGIELLVGYQVQDESKITYTITGIREFCRTLDCVPVGGGDTVSFPANQVTLWLKTTPGV